MKKYRPADLAKIKTYSANERPTKVELASFAKPAGHGASF